MKQKKNLLLLHGALADRNQFEGLVPLLEQKFSVHSISFPGHGIEALRQYHYTIESFALYVLDYLRTHKISQPLVFGYSMGGYVGLYLAAKFQDSVSGIVTLGTKVDWTVESAAKEVKQLDPEKILEKVPKFADRLSRIHGPENWRNVVISTGLLMTELGRSALNEDDFKSINVPVTMMIGDRDSMVDLNSAKAVSDLIPDSGFVVFQNTEHPFEKADLSSLAEFLINF
ncbi:MAG: alpha/beta fold hydrolase [Bacteroidia bacterium]|nr:alpha/beta fold hydrolase [Bacteroidia bacterium]